MVMIGLHDKARIAAFLAEDRLRHIYSLGDLDPFFWPRTLWYGLETQQTLRAVLLLYLAPDVPTLLAMGKERGPLRQLLMEALPVLPRRFYAHIEHGLESVLTPPYQLGPRQGGPHLRMALRGPLQDEGLDTARAERLGPEDLGTLRTLYAESYPGNWFDPRMLETGHYFGVRHGERLLSVAGIHVVSAAYGVSSLGNITTHPDARGQGLGAITTAALCRDLLQHTPDIGLNVHADNAGAIRLYERLGFEVHCRFSECMFEPR